MIIVLLAPLVILWLVFFAWPMVQVLALSVQHTNFMTASFVGLDNYVQTFSDPAFWQSVINSLFYAAIMVPANVVISFTLACFLSRMTRPWRNTARVFFYIPTLSAGIIIAGFWKWLFHIDGVINWLAGLKVSWFGQGLTAVPAIAAIVVTGTVGGTLIMTLASIEAVDPGMIDAARVDGASWGQIKRHIILPTITPTLALISLLGWIGAWQIIETPMMLAPQDYAATLTYHIYRQGFLFGKYGMASAQAVILLVIIGALVLVKRKVEA
jgi:multiple sugar transport system permease protein